MRSLRILLFTSGIVATVAVEILAYAVHKISPLIKGPA